MQITFAARGAARPGKFVQEQDLPRLQSLLRRIQSNIYEARQQKMLTDFFMKE